MVFNMKTKGSGLILEKLPETKVNGSINLEKFIGSLLDQNEGLALVNP
jgi:hypothetical protein